MRQGHLFPALLLVGERAALADGLARAFARGFAEPTSTAIALGASATADAAMDLFQDAASLQHEHAGHKGGAPAVPLEGIARLLDRLQPWAACAPVYYPVLLFLHARLATLRGRHDEARRLLVFSAGLCASMGLAYHEEIGRAHV